MESNFSCDDVMRMFTDYLYNRLSEKQIILIKNHFDKCSECKKNFQNLQIISENFQNYQKEELNLASIIVERVYKKNPINCNEVLKEVSAYYDGELNLKLHYLIKSHLYSCSSCKNKYENFKKFNFHIKAFLKTNADLYRDLG